MYITNYVQMEGICTQMLLRKKYTKLISLEGQASVFRLIFLYLIWDTTFANCRLTHLGLKPPSPIQYGDCALKVNLAFPDEFF